MRRDDDWRDHLHGIRRREFEIIFGDCPPEAFERALELGTGDGFQARLLLDVAREVVASDLHEDPGRFEGHERLRYLRADAERVDEVLSPASFDLVYSSNVLEHLPDPSRALIATRRLLNAEGLAIHVVPGPLWKLAQLLLFYPDRLARLLERFGSGIRRPHGSGPRPAVDPGPVDNNPKVARSYGWLRRQLWPVPHGAYRWNLEELVRFRRRRWIRLAVGAGLEVACVLKGPVASGYGFGLERVRTCLERSGVATEFALVAHRSGARPALLPLVCGRERTSSRPGIRRGGGQPRRGGSEGLSPAGRRNTNSLQP